MATARRRSTSAKRYPGVPAKDFALSGRHYPINTRKRGRAALSFISRYGTPAQKAKVRRAVKARYPTMHVSGIDGPERRRR